MRIYLIPSGWRGGAPLPARAGALSLPGCPPARRAAYALEGTLARAFYAPFPAAALAITRGAHGKPAVLPSPGWTGAPFCHSIAHTSDMAAVAVHHAPVGVDIEPLSRRISPAVVRGWFSPAERDYVAADPARWALRALAVWVRREAYSKLTGEGIRRGKAGEAPPAARAQIVGGYLVGWCV